MKKNIRLLMPIMVNFIKIELPGRRETPTMPVSALTREEAEAYSKELAETFLKHWEEKVKLKKNESQEVDWTLGCR